MASTPSNAINVNSTSAGLINFDGTATFSTLPYANDGVLITSNSGVPSWLANGTTGQVLTATSSSPASWANPAMLVASVNIGAAAIKTIHTTPVQVIPAVSGNTIVPVQSIAIFFSGSQVLSSSAALTLQYGAGSGIVLNTNLISTANLDVSGSSSYQITTCGTTATGNTQGLIKANNVVATSSSNPTGNSSNDAQLYIYVCYFLVPN